MENEALDATNLHAPTVRFIMGMFSSSRAWTETGASIQAKLAQLLPAPEKSEAEKLVDEWWDIQGLDDGTDTTAMVEWILAKVRSERSRETPVFVHGDFDAALNWIAEKHRTLTYGSMIFNTNPAPEPEYIYGPWVQWHGGECPVPGNWEVQTVLNDETLETVDPGHYEAENWEWQHAGTWPHITHYRVRFEVGKWYDWGDEYDRRPPLPLYSESTVTVTVRLRSGVETANSTNSVWFKSNPNSILYKSNIVAFKVENTND